MAKKPPKPNKPPTGQALNGGQTSFNEDGTFPKAVCDALRLATKNYNATISKIERATADRDALMQEVVELDAGTKERRESCEEIVDNILKLKSLRADRIRYGSVFAKLIEKADKGEVDVTLTAKQIVNDLNDADDEGDDESDDVPGQMPLKLTGHGSVFADDSWAKQHEAYPQVWGGREWPVVYAHVQKIHDLKLGNMMVGHPAAFAKYIAGSFKKLTNSSDRKNILPGAPDWFWEGVFQLVAAHARCELAGAGEEARESQAAVMLGDLQVAADHDPDAWLDLVGGKDSPINRAINQTARQAV